MAELWEIQNRFSSLNIREEIINAVQDTAVAAADAQRSQMLHGLKSDGKIIGKYRNKAYAKKKFAQNSLAGEGNKDLFLEGDFQGDILVDAQDDGLVFTSADPKTAQIVEREGEDVFGLSKAYAEEYSKDYLADAANKNIQKKLYGM